MAISAHAAAMIRPRLWKVMPPTMGISEVPTALVSIFP